MNNSKLQLEVGKTYVDMNGSPVRIVSLDPVPVSAFVFTGVCDDPRNGHFTAKYSINGRVLVAQGYRKFVDDLAEEVTA